MTVFANMRAAVLYLIVVNICLVSSYPFYSINTEEGGPSVEPDEVSIRRLGSASLPQLPASLWPVPRRRTQALPSYPPNVMSAYNLIWLPGGAVKILPRSLNT